MVFSSLPFLFAFLPAVLVVYFLLPARWRQGRNLVLLVFSLLFYAYGGLRLLPIILASILVNYFFGLWVARLTGDGARKRAVAGGMAANLFILGWFKYAGFFAANLAALGLSVTVPEIVLPIGISFYTFQGMSYIVDIYRRQVEAERSFIRVALYIALFTQLVAGPIVRFDTIHAQLKDRRETLDDVSDGFLRFLFGMAKKVLIANQLAVVADAAFALGPEALTTGMAWLGIAAYTAQIYFDFSGYSDMAIGLGRVFGLRFLENFHYPYIADSITEFWRRWHISLSSWFRDYLYIPLGGNRVSRAKQIRNLLIVWLLTGFWHGAAWNFVFWGLFYALLLMGERYVWRGLLARLPKPLRHVYALLFIMLGWVLFRSADLTQAISYAGALFGASAGLWDARATYYLLQYVPEFALAVVAALPVKLWLENALEARREKPWAQRLRGWAPPVLAMGLFVLCVMRLLSSSFNPFIYFQF